MTDQPQPAAKPDPATLREWASELPRQPHEFDETDILRANAIAEAWLAEHPADDDEPITGEWLEALGFVERLASDHPNPVFGHFVGHFSLSYCDEDDGWDVFGPTWIGSCTTRGRVRRLLAALGHSAKQ